MGEHIVPLPTSIGYSMAAKVIETGEGVTDFKPGDNVVTTGEHAQYLIMDQYNCTPAPKGIDMEQAAFFNLGHTGMYALRRAYLQLGEPAIVMGQGFVGAITAQCAKCAGALPIIVTDLDEERLVCKKNGSRLRHHPAKEPEKLAEVVKSLDEAAVLSSLRPPAPDSLWNRLSSLVSERGRVVMISQVHGESMPNYDR